MATLSEYKQAPRGYERQLFLSLFIDINGQAWLVDPRTGSFLANVNRIDVNWGVGEIVTANVNVLVEGIETEKT